MIPVTVILNQPWVKNALMCFFFWNNFEISSLIHFCFYKKPTKDYQSSVKFQGWDVTPRPLPSSYCEGGNKCNKKKNKKTLPFPSPHNLPTQIHSSLKLILTEHPPVTSIQNQKHNFCNYYETNSEIFDNRKNASKLCKDFEIHKISLSFYANEYVIRSITDRSIFRKLKDFEFKSFFSNLIF